MGYRWGPSVATGAQSSYITNGSSTLWVTQNQLVGTIKRVDAATPAVTATLTGYANPFAIEYAFGSIWVGTGTGIYRINPATNTAIASILTITDPLAFTFDGTWFYAVEQFTVSQIDPTTNLVNATYSIPSGLAQNATTGSGSLWITTSGGVLRVNPTTLVLQATITNSTNNFYGITYAFGSVWAATLGSFPVSGTITRINPATNTVTASIGGWGPYDVPQEIISDGTAIWFYGAAAVRINVATNTVTDNLFPPSAAIPAGIGVDDYSKVWVSYSSAINRIDPAGGIFTDGASHL